MNTTFHEESIKVADRFINSILFVDDQIKWEPESNQHDLNALLLTKCFAKKGKSCSFFNYDNLEDENDICNITLNSDVIVVDWRIIVKGDVPDESEEEDDVEIQEGRGYYAIELLKKVIDSDIHSPKTIIILTGENDGFGILENLTKNFPKFNADKENLCLSDEKFHITIYFKPTIKKGKLADNVASKVIEYDKLPEIINNEFATFSEGLISNVVLESISTLKRNTNKLLSEYRKELDPAYLTHRALCPIPEDSEELILDSLIGSIESILSCQRVTDNCSINIIENWIDRNSAADGTVFINSKKNDLTIDNDDRKAWLKDGYPGFLEKKLKLIKKKELNQKQWDNYDRNGLRKDAETIFSANDNSNYDFAILTHHKSNFYKTDYTPKLTLGSVVKSIDEGKFYLCIQQRCDSVRLEDDIPRRFLFLPLDEATDGKNFSILLKVNDNDYLKLKLSNNSYSLRTIQFIQIANGMVTAVDNSFTDIYGITYEWLLDLKKSHAQKISNEFAAKLSRVGIDESEWLRRS